jgi:hypothetical protein
LHLRMLAHRYQHVHNTLYEMSAGNIGEVLDGLPHLSEVQVQAALAYYKQYQAEIDADVDRHQRSLDEFLKTSTLANR